MEGSLDKSRSDEGAPQIVQSIEISVNNYSLGSVKDSEEEFLIKWPEGVNVSDLRLNHIFTIDDGATKLTDEFISEQIDFPLASDDQEEAVQRIRWIVVVNVILVLIIVVSIAAKRFYFKR